MQKLFISIILSLVLNAFILTFMFSGFVARPPEQKQVIEAPILKNIRALLSYIDWSNWRNWGYHPNFPPK